MTPGLSFSTRQKTVKTGYAVVYEFYQTRILIELGEKNLSLVTVARKTGQTGTHTHSRTHIHTNTIETRFPSLSMFKNQKIKYLNVGLETSNS